MIDSSLTPNTATLSAALLLVRLIVGGLFFGHASQKLFGWLGGRGFEATVAGFGQMGFRPARLFAGLAAITEVIAAALIVLGFLGPVGPALLVSVMVVAAVAVHPHGLMASQNGIEVPLLYAGAGVALALTGFGRYSLDQALGLGVVGTATSVVLLAVAVVTALLALVTRRPQAA